MKYAIFLTILLATLKVAHVIDWGWWIVTMPISLALGLVLALWATTGLIVFYGLSYAARVAARS